MSSERSRSSVAFSSLETSDRALLREEFPVDRSELLADALQAVLPGRLARVIAERGRDVTISYVAKLAGVARSTVYDHIDELEQWGVIKPTREMGQSTYYTLDTDNDLAHELYRLEGVAIKARDEHDA